MAKVTGHIKIEGLLDGLSFYKSKYGHLVRTKGGATAERIARDPAFQRTREGNAEFAGAARAGKLLRHTLRPLVAGASDCRMVQRLQSLMLGIKDMDRASVRGQRKVGVGIVTPEAQQLLLGFNFNGDAPFESILKKSFAVDMAAGTISLTDLSPLRDIAFPPGATHVTISGAFASVDFIAGTGTMERTSAVNLPLTAAAVNVSLSVPALPSINGTRLCLVRMTFFQAVNGVQYPLGNDTFNALAVVKVEHPVLAHSRQMAGGRKIVWQDFLFIESNLYKQAMKKERYLSPAKQVLLMISSIFYIISVNAQVTFEKRYGGIYQESAHSLVVQPDGYLILGHTNSHSAGKDTNVYIIKTNLTGDTLWTKMIGGAGHDVGYSIKPTSDGNFIIAGSSGINQNEPPDAWLIKMDANATVLWTKKNGTYGTDVALDVEETTDNGFIITGHTHLPGADSVNAFLWRTDAAGNETWYRTYGGNRNDEGHSVKQTPDGGFIFIGQTMSIGAGAEDFYVVKTSPDGTPEWTKSYGGAEYDYGQDLQILPDGYVLSGDTKNYGAGGIDSWLIKINRFGDTLWTRTYGGDSKDITHMIQKTNDGGFIIAGNMRSGLGDNPNFWLIKVDSAGVQQWTTHFGGKYHEHGYFVRQLADGGYIVLGHSSIAYDNMPPNYTYDVQIYLVRLDGFGKFASSGKEIQAESSWMVYPNPAPDGVFEIKLETENNSDIEMVLSDVTGRIVYKEKSAVPGKNYTTTMNVSTIPKGVYFLTLTNNNSVATKKVVVY